MAYTEQTFTNLGSVQAPDASQSTAFAGSTPFAFSEGTNQLLNQVTQQAVKRREDEVKMYNDNLQAALSKASNIAEGLSAQDYDEAKSKSKKAIKYIYDNPQILLGKDPEKSNEFNNMLVDIASYTQLSKATKKIEDNYNDLIKKDSDWNNEVNNYYLQQYRNTTDPNERAKMAFTPIKNPLGDFQTLVVPKLQQNAPIETRTEVDPNDKGKLIVYQDKIFDEGVYKEAFKNYNGAYLTEEWNVRPDIQQQYATPDEYIEFKAKETFVPKATSKSSVTNNVSFVEEQKNARNEASIEGRATEGAANRSVRLKAIEARLSSKNPEFKNISPILSNIEGLESNILNTTENSKETPFYLGQAGKDVKGGIPEIQKVQEVNPTYVNEKIIKGIYPKGAAQYGDAYGKLYIITDKNGNKYYTPAKEIYKIKGKEVGKEEYKAELKLTPTNVSKDIVPNTDKDRRYTKETLLGSAVDNNANGNTEYQQWQKANKELKSIESESTSGGGIKGIDEMAYNPMGRGYDKGTLKQGMKWDKHDDHIHYGFTDPQVALATIKKAKELGLNATQNPFTGKVDKVHTDGSFHYANFDGDYEGKKLGKGLDVSGDAKKMKELFEWVESTYGDGGNAMTPSASAGKTQATKGKYKFNPKTGKLELQ